MKLGTCKISLSCCDDKRYTLEDGIESLTYGHKDINLFLFIQKAMMNFRSGQFNYFNYVRHF